MGTSDLGLGPAKPASAPEGFDFDFVGRRLWRAGRWLSTPGAAAEWAFSRDGEAFGDGPATGMTLHSANVPRWGRDGLLLEGQGANLLSRSADFTHATWFPLGAGTGAPPVVHGSAPDPLGGNGAARVSFSRGLGESDGDVSVLLHADFPTTSGDAYAGSLWVRAEAPTTLLMRHVGAGSYAQIDVGTEWRRAHMASLAAWSVSNFQIGLRGGYGAGAAATVDVWNAQCERGHASSDIVTGTEPAGRAADLLDLSHPPVTRGTILCEVVADLVEGDRVIFDCEGVVRMTLQDGIAAAAFGTEVVTVGAAIGPGAPVKAALSWEPGRLALAAQGSVTSAAAEVTIGGIRVGRGTGDPLFGRLRRWRRLDRALSDAALAAATS